MKKTFFFMLGVVCILFINIPSYSQQFLDVNQISTLVRPNNSLFWDMEDSPKYEVPIRSGKHTMSLGNLWFIGKNGSGELRGFADLYNSFHSDTHTGPLKIDGLASSIDSSIMNDFNRVWRLTRAQITALQIAQANGSLAAGTFVPATDILEWPANGPSGYAQTLAPFFDANSDDQYNILDGDYPVIKGEEMLYWILNDSLWHLESGILPMGVEIRVSFYACQNPQATGNDDIVNYTTFLEYEIINRSNNIYDDIYAGFNADIDIGNPSDDYIGCHVDADAFYGYNAGEIDGPSDSSGAAYWQNSPVQSIQFLEGRNINGRTMSSFIYYLFPYEFAPGAGEIFYDKLTAYEGDGVNYANSNIHTPYMFPGLSDPQHVGTGGVDPGFDWWQSSVCNDCHPGDQRGIGATGPFTLWPEESVKIVLGFVTTFDSSLTVQERVEKNRQQNKLLKQWYENNAMPCATGTMDIEDYTQEENPVLYPNPTSGWVFVQGADITNNTQYNVMDLNGKILLSGKTQKQGMLELNTESLANGIYYIRLTEGNSFSHTIKFIKQ